MVSADRRYIKNVSRNLTCGPRIRKQLLLGLKEDLDNMAGTSSPDYEALCQVYGTPEDTAAELMNTTPADKRNYRNRKRVVILAAVFLIIACLLGLSAYVIRDLIKNSGGTYIEEIHYLPDDTKINDESY